MSDLLTWLVNDDVANGVNVVNDVNINVNDVNDGNVNDVNDASNTNTVADEKQLLINQFPNTEYWANVKFIKNIFSVSLKIWG